LHGWIDASAAADTREASASDPLLGFYTPNKTCPSTRVGGAKNM